MQGGDTAAQGRDASCVGIPGVEEQVVVGMAGSSERADTQSG